jgi:hypothetical protein
MIHRRMLAPCHEPATWTLSARRIRDAVRRCYNGTNTCGVPAAGVEPNMGRTRLRTTGRAWYAAAAMMLPLQACSDGGGPIDPGPQRQFSASGQVYALSGSLPAGLRVMLRTGTSTPTAPVALDGTFAIEAPVGVDSIDVIIDTQGTTRTTLPALIRVSTAAPLTGAAVLLVPSRWTITGGALHGQEVDVSIDAAFRPPCSTAGDINCDGFFPRAWFAGPKLWAAAALPAPVAFDHERTHQPIGAADSLQFWSSAQRMNADAGIELFRPARAADLTISGTGQPTDGILVRVDTAIVGFGAWTNWWWNASGTVVSGLVRPRTLQQLRHGPLMTHELLHTQGLKHSCSWTTVMSGYGNPCGSSATLSVGDVAYLQLAFAINNRQRTTGAQHALIAALQGERVLLRQLPPYTPAALSELRLMSADSVRHGDHAH